MSSIPGTTPCNAHTRAGAPCRMPALGGTTVCRMHGAATPVIKRAAKRRVAQQKAQAALDKAVTGLGLRRDISPVDALLEEVSRSAANVAWLELKVRELTKDDDDRLEKHPLVWGTTTIEEIEASQYPGTNVTEASGVNVWYDLYLTERKHLATVSAMALKAGIDERRVRVAENQVTMLEGVLRRIFGDLRLTPEQQALVPIVVPKRMAELESARTAA